MTTVTETEEKLAKTRSKSFATFALPNSVALIKKASASGDELKTSALATYAGHSSHTSGPFKQKLASLREWGLITTNGSGVANLTDIAKELAHPTDEQATNQFLLTAFQNCSIFWNLYRDLAKEMEMETDTVVNHAIKNFGIKPSAKNSFIKSFIDSAEAVKLAERVGNSKVIFSNNVIELTLPNEIEKDSISTEPKKIVSDEEFSESRKERFLNQRKFIRPAVSQHWKIDDIDIIFEVRSIEPLPSSAFEKLGTVIAAINELNDHIERDS